MPYSQHTGQLPGAHPWFNGAGQPAGAGKANLPGVAHLWEREELARALLGAVATGATGVGSVSFIVGEAGLGKTSLVRLLQDQPH